MREAVEIQTDEQMRTMAMTLGERLDEVCNIIEPWGVAVRSAHGYPASGPHDLAKAAGS
jgi:hypothetical protein